LRGNQAVDNKPVEALSSEVVSVCEILIALDLDLNASHFIYHNEEYGDN
jgi:hypothetical protein